MIRFKCPHCNKQYCLEDKFAGKQAKCGCGNSFFVPNLIKNPTLTGIVIDDPLADLTNATDNSFLQKNSVIKNQPCKHKTAPVGATIKRVLFSIFIIVVVLIFIFGFIMRSLSDNKAGMDFHNILLMGIIGGFISVLYLFPIVVAFVRKSKWRWVISFLAICFNWTFVLWAFNVLWAFGKIPGLDGTDNCRSSRDKNENVAGAIVGATILNRVLR